MTTVLKVLIVPPLHLKFAYGDNYAVHYPPHCHGNQDF